MWYTLKTIKSNERRTFVWIDKNEIVMSSDWEVWTTAQKEEWEQAHADDTGEVEE